MHISKSQGITASEQALSSVCERTFLSMWSYPNLFRDQGRTTEKADGKELCDLMVVFGGDVLIFSDKSCVMGDTGNLALDWSRWFKKAVAASADQIYGAERWLRDHPDKVFIDRQCKTPIPFALPAVGEYRIHRIVIATGARERCAHELGTSGSLQIIPTISGAEHKAAFDRSGRIVAADGFRPLAVGWVDEAKGFVHVFDDRSLTLVMRELDTARDLINYLRAKEDLIRSGGLAYAAGEEELLYEYLRTFDQQRGHHFQSAASPLTLGAGGWLKWEGSPEWQEEQQRAQQSRFWDNLIDEFTARALAGQTLPGSTDDMSDIERILRVMAGESRLARQGLSYAFLDRLGDTSPTSSRPIFRMAFSTENLATGYVFCFYRRDPGEDFASYRAERKNTLMALTMVYGANNPHLKQIIGIATEARLETGLYSFELVFSQPRNGGGWLQDESIRALQEVWGLEPESFNANAMVGVKHLPA